MKKLIEEKLKQMVNEQREHDKRAKKNRENAEKAKSNPNQEEENQDVLPSDRSVHAQQPR
jgi:hypothetical protein